MRTLTFCAIVIAAATFANAVENVYGWSNMKPLAAGAVKTGQGWYAGVMGHQPDPASAEAGPGGKPHPFGQVVSGAPD